MLYVISHAYVPQAREVTPSLSRSGIVNAISSACICLLHQTAGFGVAGVGLIHSVNQSMVPTYSRVAKCMLG